ncbi:MAG: acyltransferase family protein [Planctomycetota bacterium]
MPSAPATPGAAVRWPALDGLRAVAVLLVLYHHAPMLFGRGPGAAGGVFHGSRGAWIGVDLFFVLSGFLITSILLAGRDRPGALRRFWVRRALRIFPLAYAYLGALALLAWATNAFPELRDPAAFGWASAYLLNVHVAAAGWGAPALALLWSLAVEEQFYLLWPLLALRLRDRALAAVLALATVAAPALRSWHLADGDDVAAYVLPWCRMDALALGALLALGWRSPRRPQLAAAARWLALPALAVVGGTLAARLTPAGADAHPAFVVVGYSAVALAFTVLVALALDPPRALAAALAAAPLRAIGKVSYGLYVWHVITAQVAARALTAAWPALPFAVYLGAWLLLLAAVTAARWRWLEAPLLARKERWAA